MIGLPESGKSTYLAAMFHTLRQDDAAPLKLRDLPDEREYLIGLERKWLALEPISHSAHVGPKRVVMPISDADGAALDLDIPDVNGEEFQDAWEHGGFNEPVIELLRAAAGLLLFVRANAVDAPELLQVRVPEAAKPEDWHPRQAVTQAKLVDLLEQAIEIRQAQMPALAVVVSAWDTVEPDIDPDTWLKWQLPLLWQRLHAATPPLRFRLFGISAQGGDLDDPETRQRLATMDRINRPGGAHALTEPVQWLLDAQ
jgi:hypothetical protein